MIVVFRRVIVGASVCSCMLLRRWLGVDKIFLRENESDVLRRHVDRFEGMVNEGFLDVGQWEGSAPRSTMLWLNRCSERDLGGAYSWIVYPGSVDEYMVHMNGYVSPTGPCVTHDSSTGPRPAMGNRGLPDF